MDVYTFMRVFFYILTSIFVRCLHLHSYLCKLPVEHYISQYFKKYFFVIKIIFRPKIEAIIVCVILRNSDFSRTWRHGDRTIELPTQVCGQQMAVTSRNLHCAGSVRMPWPGRHADKEKERRPLRNQFALRKNPIDKIDRD